MELHATGCNAWGQLSLQPDLDSVNDRECLTSFTKVAAGSRIEKPIARLTHTLARVDGELLWAGYMPGADMAATAAAVAMAANGHCLGSEPGKPRQLLLSKRGCRGNVETMTILVDHPVRQVVAFDTGFVILYDNGTVATMGDPRFPAPLGRRLITNEEPADKFVQLYDLSSLNDPVVHITACGYTAAALTQSGSVYVWGQKSPSKSKEKLLFSEMLSSPNYIEVADGKDIRDFALGDSHAIALTTDGEIYVIGSNANGQLGISIPYALTWTKLNFEPPRGLGIVGVVTGPMTSFMLFSSDASIQSSQISTL